MRCVSIMAASRPSTASVDGLPPTYGKSVASTLSDGDDSLPHRVNAEGLRNYRQNRGTLNIGDWAAEGQRARQAVLNGDPKEQERFRLYTPQPNVLGDEALRNYNRGRNAVANLIYGHTRPGDLHHKLRVSEQAEPYYNQSRGSQMKALFNQYGKLPPPPPRAPQTQGEEATRQFYRQQKGTIGPMLTEYGCLKPPPMPVPQVHGEEAEKNLERGRGNHKLVKHTATYRPATAEPQVSGDQALANFKNAHGPRMKKYFAEYGTDPPPTPKVPHVAYDGFKYYEQSQGKAMRLIIGQERPPRGFIERPLSALA